MILIDSNILMYAAGSAHAHRESSAALLDWIADERIDAAIDTEVLQEILHRYRAIRQWDKGRRAYDLARQIFRVVIPITVEATDDARALMDIYEHLTARDALHAAVSQMVGAEAFCSFDQDFDGIENLKRIEPGDILI